MRKYRRKWLGALLVTALGLALSVFLALAVSGDLDGDGDVDRNDLNILLADRNKTVSASACGAPCDLDNDGRITALDARKLVLLCTLPRCAIPVGDTTPPTVTGPAAITVAAVDGSGTPVSDPAIQTFLNAATAEDNVDGALTPSNNAPAGFPLGPTLVTFTATDAAGNTGTATATVTVVDQTPPTLAAPANTTVAALDSSGSPASDAAIQAFLGTATAVDNVDGALTPSNNAPAAFPLGATLVTFTATDAAGNTGTATATVTVEDQAPPVVTITDPPNLSLFKTGPITVTGTVDDETATVVVNGVSATVTPGVSPTFTATGVPLKEGTNRITSVATDPFSNVGTASISVTLDTAAPIVVIDSPRDGAITAQAAVDVTGIVNDIVTGATNGDDATVEVNGIPASVSNGTFLAVAVPLRLGPNVLNARVVDAAGNFASSSVAVERRELVGQKITLVSGNNQTAPIGATLPNRLVVRLTDFDGNPVTNRPVTFTYTHGGVASAQVLPDDEGHASVSMTLGARSGAGNYRVTATATGFVGEVVFCASAIPAPAIGLKTISGENQTGVAGEVLPEPFVVSAHDAEGNPVAGVPVTYEMVSGGGSFDGAPSVTVPTDTDGRAASSFTLGPEAGFLGNLVRATFPGMTGFPAAFVVSGLASGNPDQTRVSGVVLDNSNNPVPDVTARVLGTPLVALTNDQGQFSIFGAPVGAITLEVDGTTTTLPGTWPVLHFELTTISGQDNTIGMPIFVLPLDTVNAEIVGGPESVTLQMANVPGLALTVFANSVTCPDGSDQCPAMITQVHRDKVPMPPPGGVAPRLVWTIQPAGIQFDPPAEITYPNVDGFPPGRIVDVFSFDHDLGEFVSIGTGTVSKDGSVITSDPGVGIRKGGWGFPPPPPPPTTFLICTESEASQLSICVAAPRPDFFSPLQGFVGRLWKGVVDTFGNPNPPTPTGPGAVIGVRG